MKRFPSLLLFEVIISITAGILLSKMSWLGRMGINLIRTEYKIFKSWWKTALAILAIQLILIALQWIVKRTCSLNTSRLVFFFFLFIGIVGLVYTFYDFSSVYEHRIMKEKFHLGGYLFWIGWMASNLYFLVTPSKNNRMVE